jgi:hypothetical protein
MQHPELRRWLADPPEPSERRALLVHLRGCPSCQAALAKEDPARLFALVALEPVPEGLLDRLSAGVAAQLDGPTARGRRRRGWGAIAASLLLAAVLGTYLLQGQGEPSVPAGAMSAAASEPSSEEPAFELISSRGSAEVVDLSVGGDRFVMIFDEGLDL